MKYIQITILTCMMLCVGFVTVGQKRPREIPKNDWLQLYKEFATYKCICEYSKGEIEKIAIQTKDYSFVTHQKALGLYGRHADSIGRAFVYKISPMSDRKDDDLYGFTPFLVSCIEMNTSSYLDSIAKRQYLIYQKTLPGVGKTNKQKGKAKIK